MKRVCLVVFLAACGSSNPDPKEPNPQPASDDPFATDAVWKFKVEHESLAAEGDAPGEVTTEEMTCELTAGTLDCSGDSSFFEGVWVTTEGGYQWDGKDLAGKTDGDLWCWTEDQDDGGRYYTREICVGKDGIETARFAEEKGAGNGSETRFERVH